MGDPGFILSGIMVIVRAPRKMPRCEAVDDQQANEKPRMENGTTLDRFGPPARLIFPPSRDDKCNHFLWNLKSAASMFTEAKRVTVADQDREWRRQPQCDSY